MTKFIDEYHKLYDSAKIWEKNYWMGVPCWKLPFDQVVLQELIVKTRPDYIIETGTNFGGSTVFYSSICELINHGKVITIDIEDKVMKDEISKYNFSKRIEFIHGGSTNKLIIDRVENFIKQSTNCMVILDSWHTEQHVYEEMKIYNRFVPVGGYMIVEDTHAGNPGNPITWKYDDKGPSAAVERFLKENKNWTVDYECEKHLMSFNPGGYLRRTI